MNEQTRPTEGTSASPAESTAVAPRVATLLDAAAARLAKAGVDTARHDAKLLLAEATGSTPSDVDKAALMDDTVDQLTSAAEDQAPGRSSVAACAHASLRPHSAPVPARAPTSAALPARLKV